jgi:hypothetical protein
MTKINPMKEAREALDPTREMREALSVVNTTRNFRETVLGPDLTREMREALSPGAARNFRETILGLDLTKDIREPLEQHVFAIRDLNQGTIVGGIANLEIQPISVTSEPRPDEQDNTVHVVRNPRRVHRQGETTLPVRPAKGSLAEASDVRNAPPSWAEGFLDFLLPRSKNHIIGDMAQDYHRKYLPRHGPRGAPWRFWFEAVKEVAAAWLGR